MTVMVQRLHLKFGNLSRVDVRLNTEDKKSYCNLFCRDNELIVSAGKLPLYGATISRCWAYVGKAFTNVTNDDDVDDLMRKTTRV
jgi:hypothetical protein